MIAEIMSKMIDYVHGSHKDINHFQKVWCFAKTIGELEGLDANTQTVLETAAIVHDIACTSLRERTGVCDWKLQEIEGPPMARELLVDCDLTTEQLERVVYLVGHHHTMEAIDGIDFQILAEADYLVNAGESNYSSENIRKTRNGLFKTASGIRLLDSIYGGC